MNMSLIVDATGLCHLSKGSNHAVFEQMLDKIGDELDRLQSPYDLNQYRTLRDVYNSYGTLGVLTTKEVNWTVGMYRRFA
jgi:hypothetical protein